MSARGGGCASCAPGWRGSLPSSWTVSLAAVDAPWPGVCVVPVVELAPVPMMATTTTEGTERVVVVVLRPPPLSLGMMSGFYVSRPKRSCQASSSASALAFNDAARTMPAALAASSVA